MAAKAHETHGQVCRSPLVIVRQATAGGGVRWLATCPTAYGACPLGQQTISLERLPLGAKDLARYPKTKGDET